MDIGTILESNEPDPSSPEYLELMMSGEVQVTASCLACGHAGCEATLEVRAPRSLDLMDQDFGFGQFAEAFGNSKGWFLGPDAERMLCPIHSGGKKPVPLDLDGQWGELAEDYPEWAAAQRG